MAKYYSFEAHMLHSGLQMVWKRLNVTKEMDAPQIWRYNMHIFSQVSQAFRDRLGISCREEHMKEAAEMLHYAFQQNIPKSYYVIVRRTSSLNKYSITMDDNGNIIPADQETEWTQEEAQAILMEISKRHPHEQIWLETRIPRYVRRTLYGDY